MATVSEHVRIEISPDGGQAYVSAGDAQQAMTIDELHQLLKGAGVVAGIDEGSLQAIAAGTINGRAILVAQGTPAVDGQDGWVEYFFDRERARPFEEQGGKVDLHEMHYAHNVRQGESLATVHPPQPGIQGKTVSGKTIAAKEGKKPLVNAGPYTGYSAEAPLTLVARSDGNVILRRDGTIEVLPVLTISGNVDFSTGNIDFIGSMKVTGEIRGDFSVKVNRDLEVLGGVEDAHLEIGGNVIIRKGFTGAGKGVLTAKGNVTVMHVLNQIIISERDIVIERESVNGTLKAGGRIVASKGTIVGGSLEADEEVDVLNLGSEEHTQVRVRVGRKGRIRERLGQLEKELQQSEKQASDVRDAVFRLIRLKLDAGTLPPEKEQILIKLQEVQKMLPARIQTLGAEREQLTRDLKQESTAQVVVRGTVFENVAIDINGLKKIVETDLQDVVFVERVGAIEVRPRE